MDAQAYLGLHFSHLHDATHDRLLDIFRHIPNTTEYRRCSGCDWFSNYNSSCVPIKKETVSNLTITNSSYVPGKGETACNLAITIALGKQ